MLQNSKLFEHDTDTRKGFEYGAFGFWIRDAQPLSLHKYFKSKNLQNQKHLWSQALWIRDTLCKYLSKYTWLRVGLKIFWI